MPPLPALKTPGRAVVTAIGGGMVVDGPQLGAERRRARPPLRTVWPRSVPARRSARSWPAGWAIASWRVALACASLACAFSAALTGVFGPGLGALGTGAGCRDGALRELPGQYSFLMTK
ncbi:hypothetical protein FSW04_08025 [Baekduia soli]|uniref:Uncharacterized protein n=1 Tax=Baekduia soli TaxID=496014 RepID=A0A5B8U389_9ACTN|nr:hypothetical protein [Baekduia soli]QEC47529.1 hypothetical protein FSW04_08025 [Baekduia soli]